MEWYYAVGSERRGPVTDEEWQRLVASGAIQPETLVWHEGLANWTPFGQHEQVAHGQGGLVCSQCGKAFPPEQVIRYGDQWVCAGCKPLFLQRVREGVGLAPGGGEISQEQLLARDYEVDIGGALRASWDTLSANLWPTVGTTLLVMLAYFAVNVIPYLSLILGLIFGGPLLGGFWNYFIRRARSEPATVEDAFKGFGPRFGQLTWVNVVWVLSSWLCMMPMFALALGVGMTSARANAGGSTPVVTGTAIVLFGLAMVVSVAVVTYLMTVWFFAFPLVMDKGMPFWPAMQLSRRVVAKRFWGTLLLFVVAFLLYLGGFLRLPRWLAR